MDRISLTAFHHPLHLSILCNAKHGQLVDFSNLTKRAKSAVSMLKTKAPSMLARPLYIDRYYVPVWGYRHRMEQDRA